MFVFVLIYPSFRNILPFLVKKEFSLALKKMVIRNIKIKQKQRGERERSEWALTKIEVHLVIT